MITHTGGCHCGRVRFEVLAPVRIEVTDCDCSICSKSGYLHLIVPKSRFSVLLKSREQIVGTDTGSIDVARGGFASLITFDSEGGQIKLRGDFDPNAGTTSGDYVGALCRF